MSSSPTESAAPIELSPFPAVADHSPPPSDEIGWRRTAVAASAMGCATALAAWLVPFSGVWAWASPALALCALALSATARPCHWGWVAAITAVALAVLAGIVPLPLSSSGLGIAILLRHRPVEGRGLSLALLALQSSYANTLEALASDFLSVHGLEAAAPALIAASFVGLACWKHGASIVAAGLTSLTAAIGTRWLGVSPAAELAVSAVPIIVIGAILGAKIVQSSIALGMALCLAMAISWAATPPRLTLANEVYLVLPSDRKSPDATHFQGIVQALRSSGLKVNESVDLEAIEPGALVLLPWVSVPLEMDEDSFATRFNRLANQHRWTVVIFGEHDGMGDLDSRSEGIAGHPLFRRNLTVPSGNTDTSGPLRAGDLRAWLPEAMLNRGASSYVSDGRIRVLLAADGWWAEPDLKEWLWAGDYRWRAGDRGGRLTLAHAVTDPRGATWVAIGDTTPILTRQLIADPRAARRILDMGTLIPALLLDLTLGFGWIVIVTLMQENQRKSRILLLVASASLGAATLGGGILVPERHTSGAWRSLNVGEGGYEQSNFNTALAAEPGLLEQGWRLERFRSPLSGKIEPPRQPTVSFILVEKAAQVGGVHLSSCWRIGSLGAGDDGPRLMDAQVCRIQGDAEILVGDRSAAAAFQVAKPDGPWIIILDQGFLSETAPPMNAQWLIKAMEHARDR